MWASMTTGTYSFLKNIAEKNKQFVFHFMKNPQGTIVYYEHPKKKSLFVSGRTYEITNRYGEIEEKGFVTIDFIPVTSDGAKVLEERINHDFSFLISRYGVKAMRTLKQLKKLEYVIMTQWESTKAEDIWKGSPYFDQYNYKATTRFSAYFAERPFTKEYYMVEEE